MNVGELIERLESEPLDARVVVDGYEGGYSDLAPGLIKRMDLHLNTHAEHEWWDGRHDYYGDGPVVECLVLHRESRVDGSEP